MAAIVSVSQLGESTCYQAKTGPHLRKHTQASKIWIADLDFQRCTEVMAQGDGDDKDADAGKDGDDDDEYGYIYIAEGKR